MKNFKLFFVSVFLLFSTLLFSQQDFTLYNMEHVPQRMYMNPAFFPTYSKINIGLPGISSLYLNFSNSGFKISDLIQKQSDDSLHIEFDNMLSKLATNNYISTAVQPDILSFGFRIKEKNYISVNITEKAHVRFRYPKDFMEFVWKGNGAFLDKNINFSFAVNATHYREYGVGYSRIINDKLTVGGKIKYLYGMENITTKKSDITLYTDPLDYDITAKGNIEINTSGLDDTTETSTSKYLFGKKNNGLGIDLGGEYKLTNKITLSASLIDLGFIKWKDNVTNLKSDGSFTYQGIDITQFFDSDSTNDPLDEMLDSLENIFKIDTTHNSYTSFLTSQLYIGGTYNVMEKGKAGIVFYSQFFDKKIRPGLSLSYSQRVGRWLNVSASYSMYNRSYNNIGLGLALNGGPVQLYIVSDNILGAFYPQNTKNVHLHFGINLTIGRTKNDKDKDGIPDKEDLCVEVPGVAEFKGCPDKDGDHTQDKEDECPDEAGMPIYKGCPDKDGDKIIDKIDACPDLPGTPELNGCPDKDADGVADKDDECPDDAGTVANKGCPDKDGDGLLDKDDKCPEKRGPASNNGCPEVKLTLIDSLGNSIISVVRDAEGMFKFSNLPTDEKVIFNLEGEEVNLITEVNVIVKGETKKATKDPRDNYFKFIILQEDKNKLSKLPEEDVTIKLNAKEAEVVKKAFSNLEFETGKDIIKVSSKASLDELAGLLLNHPKWRLKISGHTDNKGTAVSNLKLSQKRAEAVKNYMAAKGVREDRFKVEWFGHTKPIADNESETGRQKNRRVEMLIIE